MNNDSLLTYLKNTVKPALGCTEPVCAALASAAASHTGIGQIRFIHLTVNPGLYKNGMSVAIPHFDKVGIPYAAALGALIARTDRELEIFEDITPELASKAKKLVKDGKVQISLAAEAKKLYVHSTLEGSEGMADAEIRDSHTNIVRIEKNGHPLWIKSSQNRATENKLEEDLQQATVAEIRKAAWNLPSNQLSFLLEGMEQNEIMAKQGKEKPSPIGIASTMEHDLGNSLMDQMMKKVAESIEARLDGCPYAVTSSAGSGSKGLALLLPLQEAAQESGIGKDQLAHAIAFGHLLNSYINMKIGRLASVCTCAMAASTSAAAALTALWGGNDRQIGFAINNMTGAVSGMICDGGKPGCALKLAQATAAAYISARMAMAGHTLRPTDGICDASPEACIGNMARIAKEGMKSMDSVILDIMMKKKDQ